MRRCIGCKPKDWRQFQFNGYQNHAGGRGYATPNVCLSAAYAWSRLVKSEHKQHIQRNKSILIKMSASWDGHNVCIVMHDGSTTTLGTMLRLYLPSACVKRYDKFFSDVETTTLHRTRLIVMCEDGIATGRSLCRMRKFVGRPIDLLLTIGGHSVESISDCTLDCNKCHMGDLVVTHHQLDKEGD